MDEVLNLRYLHDRVEYCIKRLSEKSKDETGLSEYNISAIRNIMYSEKFMLDLIHNYQQSVFTHNIGELIELFNKYDCYITDKAIMLMFDQLYILLVAFNLQARGSKAKAYIDDNGQTHLEFPAEPEE